MSHIIIEHFHGAASRVPVATRMTTLKPVTRIVQAVAATRDAAAVVYGSNLARHNFFRHNVNILPK